MSLFSSPEEHAANSPDTWLVVKGGVRDSWHLTTTAGVVLETKTTRCAAEAAREGGFCARLYDVERRWYAGDQVANYRPWAEVKAEQKGELEMARAEITTLRLALHGAQCQRDDYPRLFQSAWETVEKARHRRPYLYEVLEVVAGRPVPVDINDDIDNDAPVSPDTLVCW